MFGADVHDEGLGFGDAGVHGVALVGGDGDRGEDADDGDGDHQLNEREAVAVGGAEGTGRMAKGGGKASGG